MSPCQRSPGTSAAVTTATTPSSARAAVVSIFTTRARACGENVSAPKSISGARRSSTNGRSPSASSRERYFSIEAPTPPSVTGAGIVASPRFTRAASSIASRMRT